MASFSLLLGLTSGCNTITTDFVGESYAPATHVEVFVKAEDAKRPHKSMDSVAARTMDNGREGTVSRMQDKLVAGAKSRGADAVVLGEVKREFTGSSSSSHGGRAVSHQNHELILVADMLKYTD